MRRLPRPLCDSNVLTYGCIVSLGIPLLQEIIITNFRKRFFFSPFGFGFCLAFGHWGEKRKREGEKKEEKKDQKARKGLPHQ